MQHHPQDLRDSAPHLTPEQERRDNQEQLRMLWVTLLITGGLGLACVYMMFKPM